MAERSLEEILGEVRQLAGSLAPARLAGADDQSTGPDAEGMRMRAVHLIEEALGSHVRDTLERIETAHRKNLNELWREQAKVLKRLCDEIEQVLQLRQPEDERALQERAIEITLAAVERRLMPEIEDLRLLLKRQEADRSQSAERPRLLSSTTAIWLVGLSLAFIGGALFAPELGRGLEAALGALS